MTLSLASLFSGVFVMLNVTQQNKNREANSATGNRKGVNCVFGEGFENFVYMLILM